MAKRGSQLMCASLRAALVFQLIVGFSAILSRSTADGASSPASVTRGPYLQRGTTTNVVIRWRTDQPTSSRVQFGLTPQTLTWQVLDAALVTDHAVTMTNLAENTRYYYSVGDGSAAISGAELYFYTAPIEAKPTRIWVLGDAGTSFNQPDYSQLGLIKEGQRAVRDAYYAYAGSRYTDVWLLLGDNAYNDGNDADYTSNFFNIYPQVTGQSVIWPAIGNHEVNLSNGEATAYLDIFTLPTQGEAGGVASGDEHYYSFDYGNIHFVCLDSEITSREPGSAQITWLAEDLAANTKDWLIVFWHSPPYSKGSHDSDSRSNLIKMRQNVVPLIEAYGVDLVLCGHSHVYERSYLVDGHYGFSSSWSPTMAKDSGSGRTNETGAYLKEGVGPAARQGAVYVVTGSAGWAWQSVGLNHPAMYVGMSVLGSLVIDVNSNRLDATFVRETGAVDDYFTIIKGGQAEPFRFATFRVRDGVVTAQWKSVAGAKYRIVKRTNLQGSDWIDASGDILATGATTSWTGLVEDPDESYFRVKKVN
jgi:hypothetical protein